MGISLHDNKHVYIAWKRLCVFLKLMPNKRLTNNIILNDLNYNVAIIKIWYHDTYVLAKSESTLVINLHSFETNALYVKLYYFY